MFFMEKTIDVKTSRPVLRHKMYKSGKKWIVAGIAGAAAMTYSMTVHADTTSQQVTTNSTQDINAGGNAVTSTGTQTNNNTTTTLNVSAASSQSQPSTNALYESKVADSQQGTIYTPVNVDHSKLDNAVKQASDAGVRMVHDNDTVQNTTNENVDSARQAIEDQYNDQIADINRQAAHARQETSNYNTYNGNQGDHSGLDQTVQNAQSVPGLSISKSNNQNTTVDPANDSQINQWKTNTQNDYSSQTAAINNAIATQKRYNQQVADQKARDAAIKAMQDAISKGAEKIPSAYASNVKARFSLAKSSALMNEQIVLSNNGPLSFDIDVSGLKRGDKIHIADFKVESNSTYFNGHNDFMFMDNMRLVINGVDYGAIRLGNWGNGNNGGDQFPDKLYKTNQRDTYELYAVMEKDYQGIGKQHVEVTNHGTLNSINFEVGPLAFQGVNQLNGTIKLVEHDGKIVDSHSFTLTRPTGQSNDGAPISPSSVDNYNNVWTGNAAGSFGPAITWNNAGAPYTGSVLNMNTKLNAPDSYVMASHVSTTAQTIRTRKIGETFDNSVDLHCYVIGSDGNYHGEDRIYTANMTQNLIHTTVVNDNQSESQLLAQLDRSKAYGIMSYQADGSVITVYNIPKSWYQPRVKAIMGDKDRLLSTFNAWNIATDPNPDKALQNTMSYYANNNWAPTGITVWETGVTYLNQLSHGTSTQSWHSVGAPAQNSYSGTKSIEKPVPSALIYGQSGIHVHYIDGSTGKDLRQISNSIGDPNKTTPVTPELIPGYNLTTDGAKGIPSGAQTIESNTQVAYPRDGTWKDVYIVYMPYLPSGTTKVHYHYDTLTVNPPKPGEHTAHYHYNNLNVESTPTKHWKAGDQTVDNKTSINDDIVNARIDMQVPNSTDVESGIKSVSLTDDYSQMSQYATYQSAQVMLNGQDVSSQYTITNNVQNHTVTAVAKDPSSTKAGTLSLLVNFKVNDSTPKGTQLPNSGTGEINGSTVGTGKVQLVTFTPNPVKHWVENNVTVDGKTYIDNDLVHAQVTMNLPTQAQLAKKLTNVQLIDDYSNFANKVTAQSVTVTENGKDVTSLYTITDQNGHITATRKDAASTPDGTAQLNITWKINSDVASGTRLHNSGFGVINNDSVKTNEVDIVTFIPTTSKHWVEGSQTVDGKVYVDGDTANAQVSMTLPDPNTLAKKLTNVSITDDYSQLAQYASLVSGSVKVLENGSDVTSSYTITTDNNKIVATRKDPASTPAGSVVLKSQYKIFETTPTGTKLVNSGSGTINSETVPTNTPSVVTYRPAPDKHWTEGSQTVDGKVYVDGDEVHTDVTMGLPDPDSLAKKLTNVSISDNYSDFADKVDYESATVYENGKDVTDQYSITNSNGVVTAVRKDASTAPNGTVDLHLNFKIHDDVVSGTLLNNTGSGQINNVAVTTPTRTISTFKQATDKNWIEGSQKVNGKIYINDDVAHSQITTTLPDPSTLAKKLSSVVITDDYSNFSKYADVQNVKILENNIDATSEYNIVTNASNGTIVATRKDPSTTPGGTATMQVAFKLHNDIPSGTQLVNKGNVKINSETVPTPTPSVTTYQPTTDKHWVNGTQTVDGKTFIDGDDVTGEVTMSLPEPKQLAKSLSNVSITDDYSRFADKVDYKSAKVFENGKDVTSDYTITNANGKVTAVRKDPTSTPAGSVKLQVIWTVHTDVASGTQLVNGGSGTINSDTVPTPNRTIVTYKQNTDKHWINSQGQTVDGKVSIDGDTVTARINMTLPKRSDMGGQFNKIQLIDDFSKFADKVDLKDIHVYENGKDMTDQYNITVENNHVIATRKDPNSIDNSGNSATTATVALTGNAKGNLNNADAQSLVAASNASVNFKNGVTNSDKQDQATNDGGIVSLVVSYQIKDNVPSGTKLENYGAGIINNEVVATNHPVITTWKPKAIKDVIISVDNQKSLNNSNIDLNHEFDYKLVGDALPQNLSDPLTQYGFKDDYDQSHDQYNGQYSVLLDEDVTLKDGTLLKKGTDVRKYTTQAIDVQNGAVDIEFDKDFLNKIDFEKGGFGASAYLDMKRIKAGDVYNKYSNIINGKEYVSNTVKTHTEEPKKPTPAPTPKPAATKTEITTPVQPVMAASIPQEATQIATPKVETQDQQQSNQSLPQTGNDTNKDALIGAIALGVIGMSMIPMKKRTEEF